MFSVENNEIKKENYLTENQYYYDTHFSTNEEYSTNTRFFVTGFITNDAKDLAMTIILPKDIGSNKPNITSLKVNIRGAYSTSGSGLVGSYVYRSNQSNGYVSGGNEIASVVNSTKYVNKNMLSFYCTDSNKWRIGGSNTPNNYPVSVEIDSITINFT